MTVLPAAKKPVDRRQAEGKTIDREIHVGERMNWSQEYGIEGHLSTRQETVIGSDIYKGFQICGRDQAQESWDFAEFVVSRE